jgi:hypothetical protein
MFKHVRFSTKGPQESVDPIDPLSPPNGITEEAVDPIDPLSPPQK